MKSQYTIVFYSSKDLGDLNVKFLKDYIMDGLIFCDIDKADIKNSGFSGLSILLCGSESILSRWAKQWSQADTMGYENNRDLISYISIQNLIDLQKKKISLNQAKEVIFIEGSLFYGKCAYLRNDDLFWQGRKSLFSKLIRGPILSVIAAHRSHGTATVISKTGEEQTYRIPYPSNISKYGIQVIGIFPEFGDGRAAIQLVSNVGDFCHHKLVEYKEIKTTERVVVSFTSHQIIGGVCEIVAPRK